MAVNNDKQFEIIEESVDEAIRPPCVSTVGVRKCESKRAKIQSSFESTKSAAANYINVCTDGMRDAPFHTIHFFLSLLLSLSLSFSFLSIKNSFFIKFRIHYCSFIAQCSLAFSPASMDANCGRDDGGGGGELSALTELFSENKCG